jgi:hypothetical protein
MTGRSHKKHQIRILEILSNVDSETEDAEEMSKEKELLDINDVVDLILIYRQEILTQFAKFLTTKKDSLIVQVAIQGLEGDMYSPYLSRGILSIISQLFLYICSKLIIIIIIESKI